MSDRTDIYPNVDMDELSRISSKAVKLAEKELEAKKQRDALSEQEYLEQYMVANSDLASKLISTLSEKSNQQAKLGRRSLPLVSLVAEDFSEMKWHAGKVESPSMFRNGSVCFLLARRLLEAGFRLENRLSESGKELILVMLW